METLTGMYVYIRNYVCVHDHSLRLSLLDVCALCMFSLQAVCGGYLYRCVSVEAITYCVSVEALGYHVCISIACVSCAYVYT